MSAIVLPVWVVFVFVGFKLSRSKNQNANVVGFFSFAPHAVGERAGVRPPDRTTLPAFTPGGAAL
ncbi:hypothetical protein, partial [Enterobacter intestinihominis]